MDIDITSLEHEKTLKYCYAHPRGSEWKTACERKANFLKTKEEFSAMRYWMRDSGGWEDEEISEMSEDDLNAIFLQLVASEIRDIGVSTLAEVDWKKYNADENSSGMIYGTKKGKIYFYLGD